MSLNKLNNETCFFFRKNLLQKLSLQNDEELFKRSTCSFCSRWSLVIFLLNVVLNIKELWEDYCYCEKLSEKCSVCQFWKVYLNDEFDLYKHSFDYNFLDYNSHVYNNLVKFLGIKNHIVCKLVNTKFYYLHKDWFTDERGRYYLPYCLDIFEKNQINKIKNNEFKIVIYPLPLKKIFIQSMTFFCKKQLK